MSREVRHDGTGGFEVRFPFDRELVNLVKTLRNRRWNASGRFWRVPEHDVVELVDLLSAARFRFDAATRELYRKLGGSTPLPDDDPPAARPPVSRGLFDLDEEVAASASTPAGPDEDYTVSGLNRRVHEIIADAFPSAVWIVGEISGFNRNAHRRHVSFRLVEMDEDGRIASTIDATLFGQTRVEIERALARAGDPFELEDEVSVRVRARVDLYVPWGSYRIVVEELDVNHTLGEAARRREEIIRRLTEQGLAGLNARLALPALPLRVGLVTSLGSDAYNDVLRTLEESGYAFRLTAHGARVQGRATEASVLNALDRLRGQAAELDVILICRGGGSRTDLAWFDSEALGRAVARFPLPVIVGIGHEQDHSVLDAVGRRCKTPTAAAELVVQTVRESLRRLEDRGRLVLDLAAERIRDESARGADRARRLALAARNLLEREALELLHRRARVARGARNVLGTAAALLQQQSRGLSRATLVRFTRQRDFLDGVGRAVVQGARRDIVTNRRGLDEAVRALAPRSSRLLHQEQERTELRSRRLRLLDPRRVIERGYAVLRLDGGRVLTEAGMAPAGTPLRAELRRGVLELRSEGPIGEQGG